MQMTGFAALSIPEPWHPTRKARSSLSAKLCFADNDQIQDWEDFFADADRLDEFIQHYDASAQSDDERRLLMELILASAEQADIGFPETQNWRKIDCLLRKNFSLHARSIWDRASIDDDIRLPTNDYSISPYLQKILVDNSADDMKAGGGINDLMVQFGKFWWRQFENCSPAGHVMKKVFSDRWLRFNALPDGKRRPTSKAEIREGLLRAASLADAVLGVGSRCWLVANRYTDAPALEDDIVDDFGLAPCLVWFDPNALGEPAEIVAYCAQQDWRAENFDQVLRNILSEREAGVLWASASQPIAFAPYDGGFDLILKDHAQAEEIAAEFSDWLEPETAGRIVGRNPW